MGSDSSSSGPSSLLMVDMKNFKALWNEEVYQNRERWKAQADKGMGASPQHLNWLKCWWFSDVRNIKALICLSRTLDSPEYRKLAYEAANALSLVREGFPLRFVECWIVCDTQWKCLCWFIMKNQPELIRMLTCISSTANTCLVKLAAFLRGL